MPCISADSKEVCEQGGGGSSEDGFVLMVCLGRGGLLRLRHAKLIAFGDAVTSGLSWVGLLLLVVWKHASRRGADTVSVH